MILGTHHTQVSVRFMENRGVNSTQLHWVEISALLSTLCDFKVTSVTLSKFLNGSKPQSFHLYNGSGDKHTLCSQVCSHSLLYIMNFLSRFHLAFLPPFVEKQSRPREWNKIIEY